MASAPQQQQSQAERDEIKLGQETTKRAREKSAPLLAGYQKKMNRDDSGRLAGMASADVMQSAGTDRSGQLLAAGQGGGHASTQLGAQLQQTADNSKELQDFKTKCHKDISPIYTRTIRNRMFGYNWSTSLSLFCSRPTDK